MNPILAHATAFGPNRVKLDRSLIVEVKKSKWGGSGCSSVGALMRGDVVSFIEGEIQYIGAVIHRRQEDVIIHVMETREINRD